MAEVVIPKAVLINASEIPVASADASGAPECAIPANARIIPSTVPIKPTNVAMDAMVAMIGRFCSNIGSSKVVAYSISFWMAINF